MKLCCPWSKKTSVVTEENHVNIPETSKDTTSIFDPVSLIKEFDGDKDFVLELIVSVIEELEPKFIHLEEAVRDENIKEINDIAHGMKGATQSLMCKDISEILNEMQICKDTSKTHQMFLDLKESWIILHENFQKYLFN